ncbi:putative F-box protein [Cardamine amara subsp. amara]|uniref:F-box protein n=1 Tax=Cardamine amara subsp. amara TaxID=228776 RepID=A0ABD1BV67_CARAN
MALETMSVSLEDTQSLEFEGFKGYLDISESCDGLVCIYGLTKAVDVINPITTVFVALPLAKIQRLFIEYPDNSDPVPFISFTRFGFGKDYVGPLNELDRT